MLAICDPCSCDCWLLELWLVIHYILWIHRSVHLPFIFYSPKVGLDLGESGQGTDQRRELAGKTSSSSGERKKHWYKVFSHKIEGDDTYEWVSKIAWESSRGYKDQHSRKNEEQVETDQKHSEETDNKKKIGKPVRKNAKGSNLLREWEKVMNLYQNVQRKR